MRGKYGRPFGALVVGVCALALVACGDSSSGGGASSSSGDTDTEDTTSPVIGQWGMDAEDATSDVAVGTGSSVDVPSGPGEPEVGPTDPDPPQADATTVVQDAAAPTDVGTAPPFEGDALVLADPTDPLMCTVSGTTNDVVDCAFHLAIHTGSGDVAALEFHFPLAPYAELVGISCAAGGGSDPCQGKMKGPLPSGHSYNAAYDTAMGASMILFGLNAPLPLSPAVYDGATITGETFVLAFQLKLLTNVALEVRVPTAVFSDGGGTSLDYEVVDGVWVTSGGH